MPHQAARIPCLVLALLAGCDAGGTAFESDFAAGQTDGTMALQASVGQFRDGGWEGQPCSVVVGNSTSGHAFVSIESVGRGGQRGTLTVSTADASTCRETTATRVWCAHPNGQRGPVINFNRTASGQPLYVVLVDSRTDAQHGCIFE